MDLKLIERFLAAMMPPNPKANDAVNTAFECMKAHPMSSVPSVGMMISKFQMQLYGTTEMEQATATRNVLTGIMIAWASENAALRKMILEDYLDQSMKLKGENVVSFWDKKAGR